MRRRVMVAYIGCLTYIVEPDDAVRLLEIASRCVKVEGYGPRQVCAAQESFCDSIAYEEVEYDPLDLAPAPPAPSTSELAPF